MPTRQLFHLFFSLSFCFRPRPLFQHNALYIPEKYVMNFYFFDITQFLRLGRTVADARGRGGGGGGGREGAFQRGRTIYHSEKSRNDAFMRRVIIKNRGA